MIRAVLFDLDRTLLDRDESFHRFVHSQYERFSHVLDHVSRENYVARIKQLDDLGRLGKDKVYSAALEEFRIQGISWQDLEADFESRITYYYIPFSGLREMFDQLKSSGYLLGLVTNGRHDFQMRTIRTLGIEKDFNLILISESVGVRKPDPEIFHRACLALNCEPGDTVFVGDNPVADIKGAHEAGMRTIWKQNDAFSPPELADGIFSDLWQLPSLIGLLAGR